MKRKMSDTHKKRRSYLWEHSPINRILEERDYGECSEFITDAYGDVNTYRVYGTSKANFEMTIR